MKLSGWYVNNIKHAPKYFEISNVSMHDRNAKIFAYKLPTAVLMDGHRGNVKAVMNLNGKDI